MRRRARRKAPLRNSVATSGPARSARPPRAGSRAAAISAQAPVERGRVRSRRRRACDEARAGHGPEGHAEDAVRQLHQPVGVVQPGDAAVRRCEAKLAFEQQADLRHRAPKMAGPIFFRSPAHTPSSSQPPARPRQHADICHSTAAGNPLQDARSERHGIANARSKGSSIYGDSRYNRQARSWKRFSSATA